MVEWEPTKEYNVRILNDTIDLYRYYDLTVHAEFLYECIAETIETIIPAELDYLGKYDRMTHYINSYFSLPDTTVDLLNKLLDQNRGKLSKNKREMEFDCFTDEEVLAIEENFRDIFG